jgi:hypothetical protein
MEDFLLLLLFQLPFVVDLLVAIGFDLRSHALF